MAWISSVKAWMREPISQKELDVLFWRFNQNPHMFILFFLVILFRMPVPYMLPVPENNIEVSVQQKNALTFHFLFFQPDRRRLWIFHTVR